MLGCWHSPNVSVTWNVLNILNILSLKHITGSTWSDGGRKKSLNFLNILSSKHITGSTWSDVGREKRGGGGGRVGPPRRESVRLSQRLQLLDINFWSSVGSAKALGVSCRFLCLRYVCYMNEIYDAWYLMCKYLSWAPEGRLLQPWPGWSGRSPGGGRNCQGGCVDYHCVIL